MPEINHIGIIMDGNRRWAKERDLKPWEGHQKGAKILMNLFDEMEEFNIREITLYTFSIQNFNRKALEKKFLFDLFVKEFSKLLEKDHKIHQKKIRIRFLGRLHLFPKDVRDIAEKVMKTTEDYDKHTVNFAFGYGGREEIIDAVNKVLKDGKKEITEEEFEEYLYNPSPIDLIIRTSGENRTSGFFPWQATYAELFFIDKHWPDFSREDLQNIIREFQEKRQRRFGR